MLEIASRDQPHGHHLPDTPQASCCGLLLADMGQGLPLGGPGGVMVSQALFDAAVSISAAQWLLFRPDWWTAATNFFAALKR